MLTNSTALVPISEHAHRDLAKHLMKMSDGQEPNSASVSQYLQEATGTFKEGAAPTYVDYQNFIGQP